MAKTKNGMKAIGRGAFMLGVVLVVIMALLESFTAANYAVLAVILGFFGVIVGALNVTTKESTPFLLVVLILSVGAVVTSFPFISGFVATLLQYLAIMAFPAGVVVGMKVYLFTGKN